MNDTWTKLCCFNIFVRLDAFNPRCKSYIISFGVKPFLVATSVAMWKPHGYVTSLFNYMVANYEGTRLSWAFVWKRYNCFTHTATALIGFDSVYSHSLSLSSSYSWLPKVCKIPQFHNFSYDAKWYILFSKCPPPFVLPIKCLMKYMTMVFQANLITVKLS